jgi:opacity protein-like surface antigen
MKRLAFALTVGLFFAFTVPANTQAQSFEVGPRATISLGDISDAGGDFGLGADARVGIPSIPVDGNAAFTYFFADNTVWTLDINALYPLPVTGPVSPYVGGGVGITGFEQVTQVSVGPGGASTETETTTDTALNIVGGVKFSAGALTPFVEANLGVGGDVDRFGITGGLLFGF